MAKGNANQRDKEIVEITSMIRTNPAWLIPHLEAMLPLFQGNLYVAPGKTRLRTGEGAAAVQECIAFLKNQQPIGGVVWNDGLSKCAEFHCGDQGPTGKTGHNSTDGTSMGNRLAKFGSFETTCGENISYGHDSALEIIIQLIVDDDVPSRGHRKNLFNPSFKCCGTFTGGHKVYGHMSTQNFAGGFNESGSAPKAGATYTRPAPKQQQSQPSKHFASTAKAQEKNASHAGMSMQEQLQAYMREPTVFPNEPTGFTAASTQISLSCDGSSMTKTSTKTYIMSDGSKQVMAVTQSRPIA